MKLKYFILPVALMFVGAGCEQTRPIVIQQPQVLEKIDGKDYSKSEATKSFRMILTGAVFITIPNGMSIWQQETASVGGERGQVTDVVTLPTIEAISTRDFNYEIPIPIVSIITYENKKKLSIEDWVKTNTSESGFQEKNGPVINEMLGKTPAISYQTHEVYFSKYHVAVSEDNSLIIIVRQNYSDLAQSQTASESDQMITNLHIGYPGLKQ